jgi:addiction module RelE/StbE family toxin
MRVRWTRPALSDLDEIQDYIAQDSPNAADDVVTRLVEGPETLLSTNPMIGRSGRVAGTRELIFSDLPYIVVYRVRDVVEILAAIHTARDWPESF